MRMNRDDLEGLGLADVLELLEKGQIGYDLAMDWLHIDSLNELVAIMHFNGRSMPGHRPMPIRQQTIELLRSVTSCRSEAAAE